MKEFLLIPLSVKKNRAQNWQQCIFVHYGCGNLPEGYEAQYFPILFLKPHKTATLKMSERGAVTHQQCVI